MCQEFKIEELDLSFYQENQFLELLQFVMKKDKRLSYNFFQKHLGISRSQWEIFRLENLDKEVVWAF